ncbi:hypothetical protein CAPTEDRAFT_189724 [Capitella teleta]|uniref:THD domain-containing protein n=1 Tax=Capitella teleta TaxID=283909 RepID=R7TC45_CAPTE|nr:hypothetical protein CAPTEDRAFT_189724 [Capitella teleta]|eukprot:ELT91283.1 hypothetical protein CAPTEDRAFT_189724 [Capitella teleta]
MDTMDTDNKENAYEVSLRRQPKTKQHCTAMNWAAIIISCVSVLVTISCVVVSIYHTKGALFGFSPSGAGWCFDCNEVSAKPEDLLTELWKEGQRQGKGFHVCCVRTQEHMQMLFKLNTSQYSQRSDTRASHNRQMELLRWVPSIIKGVSMETGQAVVPQSGVYFVYCQVRIAQSQSHRPEHRHAPLKFSHSVYTVHQGLPNGEQLLLHGSQFSRGGEGEERVSYLGGMFLLLSHARLSVRVSNPSLLVADPSSAYLGLFMIEGNIDAHTV